MRSLPHSHNCVQSKYRMRSDRTHRNKLWCSHQCGQTACRQNAWARYTLFANNSEIGAKRWKNYVQRIVYKRHSPRFAKWFFAVCRICIGIVVSSKNTKYFFVEKKSSATRKSTANNEQCTATRSSHFRQQYFIRRKNNFVPYSSCLQIVYSMLCGLPVWCIFNRFFKTFIFYWKMQQTLALLSCVFTYKQTLRTNRMNRVCTNKQNKQIFCAFIAFAVFSQFPDVCAICHFSFSHFKLSADWYISLLSRAKFQKTILSPGQNFRIEVLGESSCLHDSPQIRSWRTKIPPKHFLSFHYYQKQKTLGSLGKFYFKFYKI